MNIPTSHPLEAELLDQIRSGKLAVGTRLPTTAELAAQSGHDLRTVQRVLAGLASRGVLERRPRAGTFVKGEPVRMPVGFLTGWSLSLERNTWPRLLVNHLARVLEQRGFRLHLFDNLFAAMVNDPGIFLPAMERLRRDLEEVQPIGFIELQVHFSRLGPLYPDWKRPSVHCGRADCGADFSLDRVDFVETAVRHLAEQGRRRPVYLTKGTLLDQSPADHQAFWQTCRREPVTRGDLRELYIRTQNPDFAGEAAAVTTALLAEWNGLRRSQRPDALIVSDDVMMRGVATALLKAGVRVPENLLVICAASEGLEEHYGLPVVRYLYPVERVATEMATLLEARLRKEPLRRTPTTLIAGRLAFPSPATSPSVVPPAFHHP